jgi:ribosome-associated protein
MDPENASINTESADPTARERAQVSLRRACLSARIADDYKGAETQVLDLRSVTPVVDFFVITSGTNRRQLHAIAEEVDRMMTEQGSRRIGLEGYRESSWILQDYGDIVLHAFTPEARALYDLENLWGDATQIEWQAVLAAISDEPTGSD